MLILAIILLILALFCASIAYNSTLEFMQITSIMMALGCLGLSVLFSPVPMEIAILITLSIVIPKSSHLL